MYYKRNLIICTFNLPHTHYMGIMKNLSLKKIIVCKRIICSIFYTKNKVTIKVNTGWKCHKIKSDRQFTVLGYFRK